MVDQTPAEQLDRVLSQIMRLPQVKDMARMLGFAQIVIDIQNGKVVDKRIQLTFKERE